MRLPEPQTKTFSSLISDIERGQIKIPQFQREFVWSKEKTAAMLDSIIKGYPIGTFIFWRTKERLRSIRNIGDQDLPEPNDSDRIDYVLDGQQRLTSLYACLKGLTVKRENSKHDDDYSKIHIDLSADIHDQIVKTDVDGPLDKNKNISIVDLLTGELQLLVSYPQEFHSKLDEYKKRIESYQYSIIQIIDAPIEIATEIFTRINVSGKPLSLFEIMVAKTYDHDREFDLSDEYEKLKETLQIIDYDTLSDATVLQTIALILEQDCKRQTVLQLDKNEFIDVWPDIVDAIEHTAEYFRNTLRIPVSSLLPYNALIAPFAYFFYFHKSKPTGSKKEYLEDFFWRCSLGGRYSSSVESKLAQDIKKIDAILKNKLPTYDWPIELTTEFLIENGWFSAGRSYIKAILCLYAYQEPKSFNDNSIVNIRNNWLKQANSKNYHHFFPRSYLDKKRYESWYINHILNITIVDDFLNKREIGAKAPSVYMSKFKKENDKLKHTMQTHLISDIKKFGVLDDDYDRFIERRAEAVLEELKKRVITRKIDEKGQASLVNDYEEEPTSVE